ncbi:unnamed protein product [Nippostrongylus brasiliensis]|uniref:Elongin-C n=1 Tax=Nippostrongylus brasiliensis TaxID=27835 RepID=A0A0N4XNY8_NIPBR|nr:unnamed protein product [Nippostrongylus brasiliensis]
MDQPIGMSQGNHMSVRLADMVYLNWALTSLSGLGQYSENESNEVNFREIPSHVLRKVCQYFAYKVRYTSSATEIPEFNISPDMALELLMAANFLYCWNMSSFYRFY